MRILRGRGRSDEVGAGLEVPVGRVVGVLAEIDGAGVGVVSARELAPLVAKIKAATTTPILSSGPDPAGLTPSSIRQISLCR